MALTPLLVAVAREPRPWRRFLLGYMRRRRLLVRRLLLDPVRAGRFMAAWTRRWPGCAFLLFCLIKALHMGVFALLAGILMRRWWAARRWPRCGSPSKRRTDRSASPGWRWAMPESTWALPMRLAPYHRRLRPVVRLRDDGHRAGAGGAAAAAAATAVAAAAAVPDPSAAAARCRSAAARRAVLVQPNISEDAQWTPESVDRMQRNLATLSLRARR